MIYIIVGIIIISVLVYYLFIRDTLKEKFGDDVLVKTTPDVLDYSQQFDDIITYDNSADGRLGLDKCIENCKGYCVEYGMTGSALCYPVKAPIVKNFDGMIVPNDQKLSYPNIE